MASDKFIQEAIPESHKGKLRQFAKQHHTLTRRGTIDIPKTEKAIQRLPNGANKTKRERELNLAKTLRGLRSR